MLLPLLLALIAVEDVPPAKPEMSVEVEDGVKVTDEQIEEVTALAKEACAGEIERVCVRQLGHRLVWPYFFVDFKDEVVGSYVIERRFLHGMDPNDRPGKKSSEPQQVHAKGLVCSVGRLFKLKQTEVSCGLGDGLSYDHAERVLLAIEARKYRILPSARSDIFEEGVDLSKVFHVDCDPKTKRIEVRISRDGHHAYSVYGFEVHGESFELVVVDNCY